MPSPITHHVLDTALGRPAAGLPVRIEYHSPASSTWVTLNEGSTNEDGRCANLMQPGELIPGRYRVTFDTEAYFKRTNQAVFYPYVQIVVDIKDVKEHYHIPLLLAPYGYSTYRGS